MQLCQRARDAAKLCAGALTAAFTEPPYAAVTAASAVARPHKSPIMAAMNPEYDYLFKLLLIGDTGTGKSCLLHQFIEHRHKRGSSHTVGVEFGSKIVTVGGKRVKLQIWDTAGQERFRSVTRSYYRGAAGCLVVYDIASKETFERTANWVRDARTLASLDISTVLVGNKLDLRHDRAVGVVEASAFAQEHGLLFLEASALTGEGVEEAFLRCARAVLSKVDDGVIEPGQEGVQLGVGDGDGDGGGAGRRCSYC